MTRSRAVVTFHAHHAEAGRRGGFFRTRCGRWMRLAYVGGNWLDVTCRGCLRAE
jgi:hypothetical protein